MAKPMLVTVPFLLLLLDYWPLARLTFQGDAEPTGRISNIPALLVEKVPLFALVAASSLVTFVAQQRGGATSLTYAVPLSSRIANALVSYVAYIGKMLWPTHLAVLYPVPADPARRPVGSCRPGPGGDQCPRGLGRPAKALFARRMVLVSRNARAGHRAGAGGGTVHGGPVHIRASHRAVHDDGLGFGRSGGRPKIPADRSRGSRRDGPCRMRGGHMVPGPTLAERGHALPACVEGDEGQCPGAQQSRPRSFGAGGPGGGDQALPGSDPDRSRVCEGTRKPRGCPDGTGGPA